MSYERRLLAFAPVALMLFDACGSSAAAPPQPAPPDVHVVTVAPERVVVTTEWIATIDGYVNAQIRQQVSAYLIKRNYEEGALSGRAGALRDRSAALTRSGAGRAQLGEAEAQLGKTERILSATARLPSSARSRAVSSTTTCRPTSAPRRP
jgi:membrane fusion protein (multidrug efflux system)